MSVILVGPGDSTASEAAYPPPKGRLQRAEARATLKLVRLLRAKMQMQKKGATSLDQCEREYGPKSEKLEMGHSSSTEGAHG